MLKILQINLNRARAAHDMLENEAKRLSWDIVIASEPNRARAESLKWISSINGMAAIWIPNCSLLVGQTGSGKSIAWAVINSFLIVSVYISPNITDEEADVILADIEETILCFKGTNVLLAGDFNAKIPAAGASHLDRRGTLILEMAAKLDLCLTE